jgi:AraC family transcriptional regulator, transcriptional activator of pobA
MEKTETLEEFYNRKFDWMPDTLKNEIGHFNVFNHEPVEAGKTKSIPYKRRDFHKIMLVVGDIEMLYADKVVSIKKQAFKSILLNLGMFENTPLSINRV